MAIKQLSQLFVSFTQPRYMRTLVIRYGVARTTLVLSCAGFLLSLAIMTPINLLTHGSLFTGLVVCTVICCTVLPFHLYQLGHLLADLERAHQALYAVATRDELTQVHNRRYFVEQLRLFCSAPPQADGFAVLLLDIDNFKVINDTFGHDAGDLVLREVSQIGSATKRPADLFARYGGEEFAFLLPHTTPQTALAFAETMRLAVAQAFVTYHYRQISCTVSIGLSIGSHRRLNPDTLLNTADQALYAAKRNGKNQAVLYDNHEQSLPRSFAFHTEPTPLRTLPAHETDVSLVSLTS